MNSRVEPKTCLRCGAPLTPSALQGLCPRCLLALNVGKQTEMTGDTAGPSGTSATPAPEPPTLEEIARRFPQLDVLEFIGKGGMGAVYKARQKHLDRVVALKVLPPRSGDDSAFAERFTREAKALARLLHPSIVTLFEFGQADGLYYLLMEFVDGVNLRQLLAGARIAPREALAIVPQICDALQYAHDKGIVHRDIKPENILLDRRGRVKVADFGLAKLVESDGSSTPSDGEKVAGRHGEGRTPILTEAGRIMGTPQYMAPEQMQNPTDVDHRADIYALGVVFYQMLTGELPGKSLEPPSKKVQIDVRLDDVVLHALEKAPERRYQKASEVKTDVETIAQSAVPRAEVQHPELEPAKVRWTSWFPGRSLREREICSHLTAAENSRMGWLLLLFLIGHVVLLYALLEFVDRFKLGMDNLRFSYIMLSLVALLICWSVVWRWTSRRVLRSTAWGRRNVMSGGALNAPATSTQPEPARSGGRAWRIAAAVIVAVVAVNCVIAFLALGPAFSKSPPASSASTTPGPEKSGAPVVQTLITIPQVTIPADMGIADSALSRPEPATGHSQQQRPPEASASAVTNTEFKGDTQDIARLKLEIAERELNEVAKKLQVGVATTSEFEKAKMARDIAAAEIKGDAVEVARLKLKITEVDFRDIQKRVEVGMAAQLDCDKAKLARDVAAAEYSRQQQLHPKQN